MMVNHYFPFKVDVPSSIKNSWIAWKTGWKKEGWMEWNMRIDCKTGNRNEIVLHGYTKISFSIYPIESCIDYS